MVDIVEAFTVGPDDVQFGAVTFSSTARIEFTLDEHANQTSVVNDINSWVRISKYSSTTISLSSRFYCFSSTFLYILNT